MEETVVERETEFRGYSKLYAEAVETESQLSSEAALGLAPGIYQELKTCHGKYQRLLQQAALAEQGRQHKEKTRQLTLFDMMK